MSSRRLYSVLAGREVDYPVREIAKPLPTIDDEIKARKEAEERAVAAEQRAAAEATARAAAETRATTEREGRLLAEGSLAESRARVVELEARPAPEPMVVVKTVEVPAPSQAAAPVKPFDDSRIMQALAHLVQPGKKTPAEIRFDVLRDEFGRIRQIVARRPA